MIGLNALVTDIVDSLETVIKYLPKRIVLNDGDFAEVNIIASSDETSNVKRF